MTLAELFTTVHARGLIPKRAPAKKSSLTHLAKALGYPTLERCPVEGACRDPTQWMADMQAYFAARRSAGKPMTAHNCDNILTDLRSFFRLAAVQELLTVPLPAPLLKPTATRSTFDRLRRGTSPYQDTYKPKAPYRLKYGQWPADIQAGWQGYLQVLDGRIRESTLEKYVFVLETYFGYLARVYEQGQYTPTWDDLFRVGLLRAFVRWHSARLSRDDHTAHGVNTVHIAAAIAHVLDLDPAKRQPLAAYSSSLNQPPPLHDKQRYHWTTLAQIEAVANSLLAAGRIPFVTKPGVAHSGVLRAARFQLGLILKLLVRVPLRQRNIRELRYPKHLWQDKASGEWTLRFAGKELKVATRKGQVNVFEVRLSRLYPKDDTVPDDFITALETFITDFRPLLPNADTSPFLFLTWRGNPLAASSLSAEIATAMERYAGVKMNPHVIRDIAATTLLNKGRSYDMVAALLGNTVQTVIKHYAHLIPEEQIALAAGDLGAILRTG